MFNKRTILKLILTISFTMFMVSFNAYSQTSLSDIPPATKDIIIKYQISPQKIYQYAKRGQKETIWYLRNFVNMQDTKQMTAICYAQKLRDINAYSLLKKAGARTDIPCHDDKDTYCIVNAPTKPEVIEDDDSIVPFLLKGAATGGAIWLAIELLDSGSSSSCPGGYSTSYPDINSCGKTADRGYIYKQNGQLKGQPCGKCIKKVCDTYDTDNNINTIYIAGTCPAKNHTNVSTTASGLYSGDQECNKCTYTCDGENAFENEADCTNNGGYKCYYDQSSTCYVRTSTTQCDTYDTDNDINTIYTEGSCPQKEYTNVLTTPSGLYSGNQECNKCTYTCNEQNSFNNEADCTNNGGHICKYDSNSSCHIRVSENQCKIYDTDNNINTIYIAGSCPTKGYTDVTQEPTGLYSGNQECNKCTYTCNENDGFKNPKDCQSHNGYQAAYYCTQDEETLCYTRTSPQDCTPGYSDQITTNQDCISNTNKDNDASGYYLHQSGYSGTNACYKCVENTCKTGSTQYQDESDCGTEGGWTYKYENYSGDLRCGICTSNECTGEYTSTYTSISECPGRTYLKATDLQKTGYSGDTPCNQCIYTCDAEQKAFENVADCIYNNGYICTYDTESNCYYRSSTNSCPLNLHPSYESTSNCAAAFGGNEEGWISSKTTYYSGDKSCYSCFKKRCTQGYEKCTTDESITTEEKHNGYYSGVNKCYDCTYSCNNKKDSYETEAACKDGGYNCEPKEIGTTSGKMYCYIRGTESGCLNGYSTDVTECSEGYTLDTKGQSGGKYCNKCIEKECPDEHSSTAYTSATDCTTIKDNTHGWKLESTGIFAGDKECMKCVKNECYNNPNTNYTDHSTEYQDASKCPKFKGEPDEAWISYPNHSNNYKYSGDEICYYCQAKGCSGNTTTSCSKLTYLSSSSTETGEWSGSNKCLECSYKCDTKQGSYEKEENCTDGGKYTCEPKNITDNKILSDYTDATITCYVRKGGADCPDGYTTDVQDVSKCGKSGSKGWELKENGVSGELKCTKCEERLCPDNYTADISSKSLTCATNGLDIENDGYKLVKNEDRYNGDAPCYGCMRILCSDYNDEYNTLDVTECGETGREGYTLKTDGKHPSGGEQCGKCTPKNCPTGYQTSCNVHLKKAYPYVTSGYSGEKECYKCECLNSQKPYCGDGIDAFAAEFTTSDGIDVTCYYCKELLPLSNLNNQHITYFNLEGDFKGLNKPLAYADESSITPQIRTFDLYNSASSASITGLTDKQNDTPIYNAYASTDENSLYKTSANATLNIIQQEGAKDNIITAIKSENDAFNAFATGHASSIATINIEDNFTNDSIIYGMYANKNAYNAYANSENALASANININTNTDKQAYGIYAIKDVYNLSNNNTKSSININHNGNGDIFGIYSKQGNITNSGDIYITSTNAKAYGIYLEEGSDNTIENTGNIDIKTSNTAYGIYVKDAGSENNGVKIYNKGNINITANNDSRGIKIENNGQNAYVENQGTITINNQTNSSNAIDLGGATLLNMGVVTASSDLNLDSFNATHILDGGKYIAESISGSTLVSINSALDNNKDELIQKDSFITKDASSVDIAHQSTMYDTKLVKNQNNNYDVVSTRKNFNEFTSNKSLANYLENNYKQGNLNNVYNVLKQTSNDKALTQKIQEVSGSDIIPLLPQENIQTLRHLGEMLSNSILSPTNEIRRIVGGGDTYHLEREETSLLTGYDNNTTTMYMFGDKEVNINNRLGIGLAIMTSKTNYDNGSDKTENFINIFIPWIHKFKDNLNLASIFNLGYGFGHFDRKAQRADLKDYVYTLTNRITHDIDLNGYANLETMLFLNTVGYYQSDINEKDTSSLKIKQANHLSVEAGFGLYLKKKLLDNSKHKLSMRVGGAYYRELSDPYNHMSANIIGGNGIYRIDNSDIYDHNRAVLDASLDYQYKSIDMYLKYYHLIQENKSQMLDFGVKYNF